MGEQADKYFDVEDNRKDQFADIEYVGVEFADFDGASGLEDERGQGESDPTPTDVLVDLFGAVALGTTAVVGVPSVFAVVNCWGESDGGRKSVSVKDMRKRSNIRGGSKGAFVCILANGGECVCDYGDEQVDQPEIQDDNANDEEEARHVKL